MSCREEIVSDPWSGRRTEGSLASLVDLYRAFFDCTQGAAVKATADLRVDYHRPVPSGALAAQEQIIGNEQQISEAGTRIVGSDVKFVASGRDARFS